MTDLYKSNLNKILDRVTPRCEVTLDVRDCPRADVAEVISIATKRGLNVSGTWSWLLIRDFSDITK